MSLTYKQNDDQDIFAAGILEINGFKIFMFFNI